MYLRNVTSVYFPIAPNIPTVLAPKNQLSAKAIGQSSVSKAILNRDTISLLEADGK